MDFGQRDSFLKSDLQFALFQLSVSRKRFCAQKRLPVNRLWIKRHQFLLIIIFKSQSLESF